MAKRLGGIGEVIRIGTERLIVSEVSFPYCNYTAIIGRGVDGRISDLLRWGDHRICMLIL